MSKLKPLLFNTKGAPLQDSIFDCLSSILPNLGTYLDKDTAEIIDYLGDEGFGSFTFSNSLVVFMDSVALYIPSSEKAAQVLLDYIGWILAKRRFDWSSPQDGRLVGLLSSSPSSAPTLISTKRNSLTNSLTSSFAQWNPQSAAVPRTIGDNESQLAMETVVAHSSCPVDICGFICEYVVPYLKHQTIAVRLAAVATCCFQLSEGSFYSQEYSELGIVLALLSCAVTDPQAVMRETILQQLLSTDAACLKTTDAIHSIAFTLNDSQQSVRILAAELIGRASRVNPATAQPILRRILIEALLELEFESPGRKRFETFDFLAALLKHSHSSIEWPIDLLARKVSASRASTSWC
jgi:hypothetical protein